MHVIPTFTTCAPLKGRELLVCRLWQGAHRRHAAAEEPGRLGRAAGRWHALHHAHPQPGPPHVSGRIRPCALQLSGTAPGGGHRPFLGRRRHEGVLCFCKFTGRVLNLVTECIAAVHELLIAPAERRDKPLFSLSEYAWHAWMQTESWRPATTSIVQTAAAPVLNRGH